MRWDIRSVPRWALIVIAWVAIPGWTIFLFTQMDTGSGVTGIAVKILGSLAVLYILFLALRPRGRGILDLSHIKAQENDAEPDVDPKQQSNSARWLLLTLTIALAIGSILYRLAQD